MALQETPSDAVADAVAGTSSCTEEAMSMDESIRHAEPRVLALVSLYICESLLLELTERKLVDRRDVQGLLKDAAKALAVAGSAENGDFVLASEIVENMRERYERLPDSGVVA